jgi:uncharacterized RDD family membrane protein YckC
MTSAQPAEPASFLRRLSAAIYDALLITALMAISSLPIVVLNSSTAIAPGNIVYQFLLLAISMLFYCGFWLNGGQTLGMKAWRLQLVSVDDEPLTIGQLVVRFAGAWASLLPLGLGFFWILVDRKKMAWHDHWSGSRIIVRPKPHQEH